MKKSNDINKIIIIGLEKSMDDSKLHDMVSEYGTVVHAKIVRDSVTDMSKGFGFVTFSSAASKDEAINGLDKKIVNGRTLHVRDLVAKEKRKSSLPSSEIEVTKPVCWGFQRGNCQKGDQCAFSHSSTSGYGVCFDYTQNGKCRRKDSCKFLHPEKNSNQKNESTMESNDMESSKGICYAFQNGKCHRGKSCAYLHTKLDHTTLSKKRLRNDDMTNLMETSKEPIAKKSKKNVTCEQGKVQDHTETRYQELLSEINELRQKEETMKKDLEQIIQNRLAAETTLEKLTQTMKQDKKKLDQESRETQPPLQNKNPDSNTPKTNVSEICRNANSVSSVQESKLEKKQNITLDNTFTGMNSSNGNTNTFKGNTSTSEGMNTSNGIIGVPLKPKKMEIWKKARMGQREKRAASKMAKKAALTRLKESTEIVVQ